MKEEEIKILEKFLEYANCKECEENKCCPDCFIDKQEVQAIQGLLDLYEKEKEKNKKLKTIINKLMPLAECSYWNYENHTCSHTCRGCCNLNENNRRTETGLLIDKDRYCRLYEDGDYEEDTKFVNIEELIQRHTKIESLL